MTRKANETSPVDADGHIRPDVIDLNAILDNIDADFGRNDAIRTYILALRDLEYACGRTSYHENTDAICKAHDAVDKAFSRLVFAQYSLNLDSVWRLIYSARSPTKTKRETEE
jgi:hypothetical protein